MMTVPIKIFVIFPWLTIKVCYNFHQIQSKIINNLKIFKIHLKNIKKKNI